MKSLENRIRKVFEFKVTPLTNKVVIYSLAAALLSNCGIAPKNNPEENEKDTFKHEDTTKFDTFEISNHEEDTTPDDSHYEIFTQEVLIEDSLKDTYHLDYLSDIPSQKDSYPDVFIKDALVNNDSHIDTFSGNGIDTFQDSHLDTYSVKDLIKEDTSFEDAPQDIIPLGNDSEEVSNPDIFCFQEQYSLDKDEDGYGDKTSSKPFCSEAEVPFGYVLNKEAGWDCNDDDSLINPVAVEICDAADNNCNGKTDEGLTLKQQCGDTDVGECKYGVELNFCLGGEYLGWQLCDAVYPKEEVCDGKDNDCDGITDEGLLLQQKCGTTDAGECSYGVEFNFCVGKYTGWQICDAVFPTKETCDDKDNNCNGLADEGLTLEQECGITVEGECELGVEYNYCLKGIYPGWMDCTAIFPAEEKCNGLDDNCDGETDEKLTLEKECGFNSLGECSFGTETNSCIGGQYAGWKNCTASFPMEEICDNLDNDCDGKTDEDLVLEQTCGENGVGNCILGIESTYCEDGKYTEWLDCNALFPSVEVCNGMDDDCNGVIDEGLTLEQECGITNGGECTLSSEFKYCINGEYGAWLGCKAVFPTLETCDSLDNNCDGEADENFPVGKKCSEGEGLCKSEGIVKCTLDGFSTYCNASLGLPVDEKCDNLDNNCNGVTDENLVQTCYSICGEGIEVCTAGAWTNCNVSSPELEVCDHFDNDCDGEVDEEFEIGEVCYLGQGECKSQGTVECTADGFDTYCTAISGEPKLETCNSLDDNCDGMTDENLTQSCSTSCGSGLENCVDGEWKNCTALQPKPEVCDGKDNDCNGKIDELVGCCPVVGYWNFDEGSGNIAYDSSGKGNNGTIYGGASWVEGIAGKAISFDGKDDYIKMSYYFNDLSPTGSVSLWFNLKNDWPNGDKGQFFLFSAKEGWAHNLRLELSPSGNFIFSKSCGLGNNAKNLISSKNSFDKNSWYNVVAVLNGADMWLYINGQLDKSTFWVGESGCSSGMHTQATSAYLGAYPANALYINGSLDEVKAYSCALTEEQVLAEYANGTKNN